MANAESVLVVPTACVDQALRGRVGFVPHTDGPYLQDLLASAGGADRVRSETDEDHLQVIPYCVVTCGHTPKTLPCHQDAATRLMGCYRRHRTDESRLADNYSIGFGGHVDLTDAQASSLPDPRYAVELVLSGLGRELSEELGVPGGRWARRARLLGYLRLTGSKVDRVHLGLVYNVTWDRGRLLVRDPAIADLFFAPPSVLRVLAASPSFTMESWSRTLLEQCVDWG